MENPRVVDKIEEDGSIPSYEEFDRLVLEESGYDADSESAQRIIDGVVADRTEDKLFKIRDSNNSEDELNQTFKIDGAVYEVLKNQSFDEYWRKTILDNLDTEKDKILLEQIDDSFIGDYVYKKLNELGKLEVLYYIDLFREILSISENEDSLAIVDIDDKAFEGMPNVMRLY